MSQRLYTEKQASISAALAGPIPPGILIYLNYKNLGKDKEAYLTLGVTLIFTVLLFYGIFQIPEEIVDKIPNFLFTALYGLIVYIFYHYYMVTDVNRAFEHGATKGSNWTVAGISVIGLILNVAIIFGLAMNQPVYAGERIEVKGNELYYDVEIPQSDVDKLLSEFESKNFFGEGYGNTARLQLLGNEYYITMMVDEELWSDPNIISFATSVKWFMEVEFGRTTHLKLESPSLSGNSKFKYITD
ncbi:MAG: hypothetical protein RIA69_21010 [Cyclobacteriaceae bacterium]